MSRATADVVDALAGHDAPTGQPVEATPYDIAPEVYVRLLGPCTRTAARSADGTANVLGGEVARCSVPYGRALIDNGRAVPCDEAGVMLDGRGRPAWAAGLVLVLAADASAATGQDMHKPAVRAVAPADLPVLVAADELPGALVTVRLDTVHLEDALGRQYGPGDVIRGKGTTLNRYVARGQATRLA